MLQAASHPPSRGRGTHVSGVEKENQRRGHPANYTLRSGNDLSMVSIRAYSSDVGSDKFFGDLLFSSDTNSFAHAGTATLCSTIISFAVNFCPYSFSLALPSERKV